MSELVLGLDISVNSTGFAKVDTTGGPVGTTTIEPMKGLKGMLRIQDVHCKLLAALAELQTGSTIKLVVVEDYGGLHGANQALIEMWVVLRYALHLSGLPYVVVPVGRLKTFGTGKGNADKVMMCRFVQRRFGVDFLRKDWKGANPKQAEQKPPKIVPQKQKKPTKKDPNPAFIPDKVIVYDPPKPALPAPMPENWGEHIGHWRDDEADAFLLAAMGLHLVGASHPMVTEGVTDYEARAVAGQRHDPLGELEADNVNRREAPPA